jgi:hypothetical protein
MGHASSKLLGHVIEDLVTDLKANAHAEEFDRSGGCIRSESGCIGVVMIDGCMMVMSRIGSFVLVEYSACLS